MPHIALQQQFQSRIQHMLTVTSCLPVLAISDTQDVHPLVAALQTGGIFNIEVTLRTPNALEVIREIAAVPGMVVGAGTVFTAAQVEQCKQAGAAYIVSPGFSETVFQACLAHDIPYLPGAVTPTEIQRLQEKGFQYLKFFPAEASGGIAMLKALAPVFKDIKFCATGGITFENRAEYMALSNVIAVGMSAMVPAEVFASKNWSVIPELLKKIS